MNAQQQDTLFRIATLNDAQCQAVAPLLINRILDV